MKVTNELKRADIEITRTYLQNVTKGNLFVFNEYGTVKYSCVTIELPWNDNLSNVSCIPIGTYQWEKVERSASFNYPHIHILNVPNRSGIKIHVANYVRQLRGCIAPGLYHVDIDNDGTIDVTNSRISLTEILNVLPQKGTIRIV